MISKKGIYRKLYRSLEYKDSDKDKSEKLLSRATLSKMHSK